MSARLLSAKEAAAQLGIHWKTLYRMAQTRAIAFVKVGGALRFQPEDLEAYIRAHREPSKAERRRPAAWAPEPVIDETFH